MSLENATMVLAGFMILLSLVLAVWVDQKWLWFTAFIGGNLIQQAFSGFCPAAIILNKAFGFQPAGKATS
jgi:hypothetical protein